jgi:hypothetical protein
VTDDDTAVYSGAWTASDYGSPLNETSHHDNNEGKGAKQARFEMNVPEAARYDVRFAYISASNRASNVPVTIEHAGGLQSVVIDERKVPKLNGHFVSLGIFPFTPAKPAVVLVSTTGTDGFVSVDAVQLVKAPDTPQ